MPGNIAQQIAVAFALTAFAVSVGAGLVGEVPAAVLLPRSLVVLLVASAIGRALGHVVSVAVKEHLAALLAAEPIPEPVPLPDAPGAVEVLEEESP